MMIEEEAGNGTARDEPQKDASDYLWELILEYETERDPFRFFAGGFSIWPAFRFSIVQELLTLLKTNSSTHAILNPSRSRTIARLARNSPGQLMNLFRQYRQGEQGILGKSHPNYRRDEVNGKLFDIYFDYILQHLPSFLMCEPLSPRASDQPYSNVTDDFRFPLRLLRRIRHRKEASLVQEAVISDFKQWLRSRDFNLWSELSQDLCNPKLVANFLSDKDFYSLLLRIRKPRLVLVANAYGSHCIVAAARALGIPVWELQHGMISKYHFGYNYSESALPYREFLPLPDKILTFGQYSSQVLVSCGYWRKEDVPVLGFARLNYFREKGGNAEGVNGETDKLCVMISTQWPLADEYILFIRELRRDLSHGVKLLINPHPNAPREALKQYHALSDGSVEIMDPTDSLYDRLDEVDVHCACYSTTLSESVGLGIPTVVLGLPGWKNAEVLVDRGASLFARSPKELAQILHRVFEDRTFLREWREETKRSGSYFWEPFTAKRAQELFSWAGRGQDK